MSANPVPIEELKRLYFKEGLPLKKLGVKVGLSSATVHKRLKEAGCDLVARRANISKIPIETLVDLYFRQGLTLEKVGSAVGQTASNISSRLRRAGYSLRSGAPPKREPSRTDEILDAYVREGLSIHNIAKQKGLGVHLVWSRLRDAGVIRKPGHHLRGIWAERKRKLAEAENILARKPHKRDRGGRPKGRTIERRQEAEQLSRLMSEFEQREGTKRGALRYAARKVYVGIELQLALDRADKTLKEYRRGRL